MGVKSRRSMPDAMAGTSVSATSRLASREYVMVRARSVNSCFVRPSTNTIGANTHTVVRVDAVTAPSTCPAPDTAAWMIVAPLARRR